MYAVCVCVLHVSAHTHRDQKRALDPLELELQAVVNYRIWVLGTELRSSRRASKHFLLLNCLSSSTPLHHMNVVVVFCFFGAFFLDISHYIALSGLKLAM